MAIRTAMTQWGGSLLGRLPATDTGHRGPRIDCGAAAEHITAESMAIACGKVALLPAPADRGRAPDKLYIAIDGTGVPMVPAAVTGHAAKTGDGRARTREVKLAALFTQTRLDEDGQPRLHQLPGQLRPRRAVRHPGGRRSPPPRRR